MDEVRHRIQIIFEEILGGVYASQYLVSALIAQQFSQKNMQHSRLIELPLPGQNFDRYLVLHIFLQN